MDVILGWVSSYKLLNGPGPFYPKKLVETGSLLKTPLVSSERKKKVLYKKVGLNIFSQETNTCNFKLFLLCAEKVPDLISENRIQYSNASLFCIRKRAANLTYSASFKDIMSL